MIGQNVLEQMLTGKIPLHAFVSSLKTDVCLQMQVRELIPSDAINNRQHIFWTRISYDAFKRNRFDFIEFLCNMCRFDGSISDNLNVFSYIKNVYTYSRPDFQCTVQYREAFDLYLDIVKDCYDGPEVRHIVEQIIQSALLKKTKKEKREFAKESLTAQFHLTGTKRPHWIQGPEWPLGVYSPMAFDAQCRNKESVQYRFIDVNTNEVRTVVQFY